MVAKKKEKKTRAKAKPGDKRLGNQFWTFRTKHGSDKIFSDPVLLWEECAEYFQYCQSNPLLEDKVFHNAGEITRTTVSHIRAMTIKGLCFYLKITDPTWQRYKKDKDLCLVIHEAEQVIYDQKFSGAAADMLNANIIARDLKLVDKKETDTNMTVTISPTDAGVL